MTHLTEPLAHFAAQLTYADLPPEVIETTKRYLADYFAALLAGYRVNTVYNHAVTELICEMGGKPEAHIPFGTQRLPAEHAAYLAATYAHGADMDDGNRKAMGHIGAHVISVALVLCETLPHKTGKDLLVAINVGYEVYNRVAAAAQPGLVHRGFHSTGTAGAIACAATAAKLMGLPEERIASAMAYAAVQASGLILIAESGQSCKPVNPANAARTGIFSAKVAAKGVDCPKQPLESEKGWLHAMTDSPDPAQITDGLGERFTITESYLKPYPSCRHTHCGIEGALRIRERIRNESGEISASDIQKIEVFLYENAIRIAGQILLPTTQDEAKFSIHYSLARALLTGHFNLSDLTPGTEHGEALVISRTTLIPTPAMEDRDAGIRGARVRVTVKEGTVYEETVLIPKGDATHPFTWEDLQRKLADCAEGLYSPAAQEALLSSVRSIEQADHFYGLQLLARA